MSLADRLLARERPSLPYPLQMTDPATARAQLAEAERLHRQARLQGDPETIRDADVQVEQARAAIEACYETLTVRAMHPPEYEELFAAHPPTDEQRGQGEDVNPDTFRPALLARCVEGDMDEAQWAQFLDDNASQGEVQELYVTALAVNQRARVSDPLVPKGWTATRS